MPEEEGREKLAEVIRQWNANRLDLFEISQPDENLEFHGVMRFYFEDQVGGNVATKCLRVGSNSSTRDVIETLSEKFRPDMKMLTTSYFLYEIHASKERRLGLEERPLVLQLNWTTDSREGRFVLKKGGLEGNCREKEKGGVIQHFKRTLSRKEKKKNKATHKESEEDYGLSEKQQQQSSSVRESKQEEEENNKQGVNLAGRVKPDFSDKPGLPIRVTFSDNTEDAFLSAVINYTNSSTVHFKLSPAYILYAAARFALQRQRSRGSPPHSVALTANKMVAMTRGVIQRQQASAGALAFWMANASELLNFLQQDEDVGPLTRQSQLGLSHLVHRAYSYLLQCLQNELRKHLPTFLIDPEHHGPLPAGIERVLNTLMNCMSLLRRCRVNPALTIQLFSQLFHFISAWLFNRLMGPEADSPGLRSHYWGAALRQRLMAIEAWAERQGLELAADCHLGHIVQATTLLTMNKYSTSDASNIQKSCFKLNSLQMQALLAGYLCATNEPRIPPGLMDAVVAAAEASADNLIRSEGRDMKLEESLDLRLPFLLPEGGYSCDGVRGIPPGFREFLEPICFRGLCSLTSQPNSSGDWTVFFGELSSSSSSSAGRTYWAAEPETETITLNKPLNSGMGVSIVAAKGVGQSYLGIYIKSIVGGGPAEMNGRLTAGDQLLSVDGQSLVGLSQERAAALMMQTGPVVTLQVAKSGASYHGLSALLSHQTPGPTEAGDESRSNGRAPLLYSVLDPGPSEKLHGRRKQEQIMQRNRQLYRSNPNMTTGFGPEGGDEPVVRRNHMAAVSSINLCADAFHREYLTLPTPKSQDKKLSEPSRPLQTFKVALSPSDGPSSSRRSSMRQALSQDNLSLDSERPLLDRRKNSWDQHANQSTSLYGSFPIRSSVSTRDILSDPSRPTKPQEAGPRCGAGVWRTPFSQPPTPSIQPIRIDIPVTRAASAQKNPPLTTFQSRTLNGNKPQNQTSPDYLTAATKKIPPQQPGSTRNQPVKPQVSITPTKHVSFQEPPAAQKRSSGPVKQRDPDPWKREAQEKQEEQQRLQAVKLLEQEVQELQTKAKPTAEESDRLRRLSLEWQFQKRLKEIQQGGSDDDDDEEEEDLEMMLTLKQLEARTKNRRSSPGGNETENPAGSLHLPQQRDEAKTDLRPGERTEDVKDIKAFKEANEKIKRAPDPENLTFKERQRLFSA